MTLAAGDRLGPYEVIAPIGVGGMGEVYRARDTKLNRDVALKVLPEVFVRDPERLARFHGIVPRAQSRNSTKPAALKAPSNARASRILRARITAKLVASTKEYSRSSWRRSHRRASDSRSSPIWITWSLGE